jgi:hypothetical protein
VPTVQKGLSRNSSNAFPMRAKRDWKIWCAREEENYNSGCSIRESASVPLGAVWKRTLELYAHNKKPNLQGARRICCLLFISHTTCECYKLISRSRRREHYVVRRGEKNLPSNIMRLWISRRKILGARVWKKPLL